MFIAAMNRFRVKRGAEGAFEKVWLSRDSYLDRVPGFVEFHLLKGPEGEDHTLYASHTVWQSKAAFEAWTKSELPSRHGPSPRNSALRTRAPATMRLGHSTWSIPNSRASRYDRR
jgi:heme-degrading monooxygenase HmoA